MPLLVGFDLVEVDHSGRLSAMGGGIDVIGLVDGSTVSQIRETSSATVVFFDDPTGAQDAVYVRGNGVTADSLTFETFDTLAFA